MSNFKFSQRVNLNKKSLIGDILKLTADPDVISFAGGLPKPSGFPVDRIKQSFDKILSEYPATALQYNRTNGYSKLIDWVVEHMATRGANISKANVLIVSGSQQALDLIGKAFIDTGSNVLIEAPSYLGAVQCFEQYQPRFSIVKTDENGLIPSSITEDLAKDARFIYTLPNFHNPNGSTLSLERRIELLKISQKYNFPIIEDDPYGELIFEGSPIPSLLSLSQQHGGTVLRMGSFSKILSPGMRVGYLIADEQIIEQLTEIKEASDIHTSTITQMAVYETIKDGFLEQHLPKIREIYKNQCDYMVKALDKYFKGTSAVYNRPKGGMFVWMRLPAHINTTETVFKCIKEYKVAYVPGQAFYTGNADSQPKNELRLSFATVPEEKFDIGISKLAECFNL